MRRSSDWEGRCKRHPEHRQSRGVCPFCLRDRLAHLSATSSSATTTTRASTSSATTTSPSYSAGASPPVHHRHVDVSSVHVFRGGASSFVDVTAFSQPLMPATKKPAEGAANDGAGEAAKKKKSGNNKKQKIGRFLSRLVGAEKRRQTTGDDELFHSRTMKEKTASKWVFF